MLNCIMLNCVMLAGLAQHSSLVLLTTLDISCLEMVSALSRQTSLKKNWNGDLLVFTPAQIDQGDSAAAAAAQMGFACLAVLLR